MINDVNNRIICIYDGKSKIEKLEDMYLLDDNELVCFLWIILTMKYNYSNEEIIGLKKDDQHFAVQIDDCRTIDDLVTKIKRATCIDETSNIVFVAFSEIDYKNVDVRFMYDGSNLKIVLNEGFSINNHILNAINEKMTIIINTLMSKSVNSIDDINVVTKRDIEYYDQLNYNSKDYIVDKPLGKFIEIQTKKTPNKIAVYFKSIGYTYDDINGRANNLSNLLRKQNVNKGDYVPVLMNKSVELIISFLAIIKIGGVFVPIDVKWPDERVRMVIYETKSKLLLVDEEHAGVYENSINVKYASLYIEENINCEVTIEDNIYAIFTSGSTGIPKGAINKHKGIVNRFLYMNKRYQINDKDVILLTANHAFDSAVWQMLWPLINGNAVVIPDIGANFDVVKIIKLIDQYKITITDFVPSVFNLVVDFISIKQKYISCLESLRQLLIGGEEMQADYVYRFKHMFPKCSITNTYGPAEASIGTVFYELPPEPIKKIPIGRPIDNVNTYIYDLNGRLMPIGSIGILFLGGICVGSGYVNNGELTGKVFKNNEITEGRCEYMYNTGDIVQINENGEIDFWGRMDDQVKINGVRIEIKEIEKAILQYSGVHKCCVIVTNDNSKKLMYAFYSGDSDLSEANIRKFLSSKIPKAMMPHFFVKINDLPLNSNGKTDVKKLKELTKKRS